MGTMIVHQGRVAKITSDTVTISITPEADECSGCAATLMCGKQEKVEIPIKRADTYKVGQTVRVGMLAGVQRRATFLFFIMPVIILMAALGISIHSGASEWASALISLGAMGAWYGVLYACRVRIRSNAKMMILD